jgi:hypothetical protein
MSFRNTPNKITGANSRPALQADSSGNLFATVAADRAFPAAVAELGLERLPKEISG